MRALLAVVAIGLCLVGLSACSNSKTPPVGRWEGAFETPDATVTVRLEITSKGEIFLSAPNATDVENASADQRSAIRQRLANELAAGWSAIEARPLEFDGRVFRKPGGIAPQLEWNPDARQMTAVLYLGLRAALRVPLRPVTAFDSDPWAS